MGCALCRTCVSKKKRRTVEGPFDLDLAVIHGNITVMGYPSTGIEACYRNPYADAKAFLDARFGEDYLVVNLCSEPNRQYDPSVYFGGRCLRVPFPDHSPCTLREIPQFVETALAFINAPPASAATAASAGPPKDQNTNKNATKGSGGSSNKGRMVVIHCKAGKGRSGLMACVLLMALNPTDLASADRAMDYYARMRTHDGKGLTIPSQRRYVQYYEQLRSRSGGEMPGAVPVISLNAISIYGLWRFVKKASVVRIRVGRYDDTSKVVQFALHRKKGDGNGPKDGVVIDRDKARDVVTIRLDGSSYALLRGLQGDVRIDFLKSPTGKPVWVASLSVHTLFVKPFYPYPEIDKLNHAKGAAGTSGIGLTYARVGTSIGGTTALDAPSRQPTNGGAAGRSTATAFSDASPPEAAVVPPASAADGGAISSDSSSSLFDANGKPNVRNGAPSSSRAGAYVAPKPNAAKSEGLAGLEEDGGEIELTAYKSGVGGGGGSSLASSFASSIGADGGPAGSSTNTRRAPPSKPSLADPLLL